jgi:hypothetical protein
MSWERRTPDIFGQFEHFLVVGVIGDPGLVVARDVQREISMYLTCREEQTRY